MKIHDEEIKEWLNDCPTHKWEVQHLDDYGMWVSIRFNNEPLDEEENENI